MSQKSLGTLFIVIGIFLILIRLIDLYPYRMDYYDWRGVLFGIFYISIGLYLREKTKQPHQK